MFDSCICIDTDCDVCRLLSHETPTARKVHRCGECGCVISPGEQYEKDVTIFDGHMETHKTCIPCTRVRASLFRCGWYYGEIWEDVHQSVCGYSEGDEMECVCPTRQPQEN